MHLNVLISLVAFFLLLKHALWVLIVHERNSIKLVEYVNRKSFPCSSTCFEFLFLAYFNIYQQNQSADIVISYLLERITILVEEQIFGQM